MGLYHNAVRLNRRLNLFTPKISEFAFILGAMKSGTSTLWSYLIQHPRICRCLFKEPNFWSGDVEPKDVESYYRLWLPNPLTRQIALEASPQYTASPPGPNVADRLRGLPGRKHFFYLVRDPVQRVESHIAHAIGKGQLALDKALILDDFKDYVSLSSYYTQLSRYRLAFPDATITILDFDELKRDPVSLLKRACIALEIDPDYRFEYIGTKNPRKDENGATSFRLARTQEEAVRDMLKNDIRQFEREFGFSVSKWGFS
jgi:Sulfotransferase domain